ncbi:MAG: HAMP domain-containing sensor histidine kinase [Gemmatimonadota bacterium]
MTGTLLLALLVLAFAAALVGLYLRERGRTTRLRDELQEARRATHRSQDARDAFFDLATHELRSPLAAILGYQELLADGAYGDLGPAREPVHRIGRSADHLLHLIDGVVELSRLRTGSLRPDLGPVDLGIVLSAVADGFRARAAERSIEPRVTLPGDLPTLRSDQDRLVRSLDLLVTSALKHPADAHMDLDVRADAHGVRVRIQPADLTVRANSEDPAARYGIRLAIVDATATLLGGALDLEAGPEGHIRTLTLRIRDAGRPGDPALTRSGPDGNL